MYTVGEGNFSLPFLVLRYSNKQINIQYGLLGEKNNFSYYLWGPYKKTRPTVTQAVEAYLSF